MAIELRQYQKNQATKAFQAEIWVDGQFYGGVSFRGYGTIEYEFASPDKQTGLRDLISGYPPLRIDGRRVLPHMNLYISLLALYEDIKAEAKRYAETRTYYRLTGWDQTKYAYVPRKMAPTVRKALVEMGAEMFFSDFRDS